MVYADSASTTLICQSALDAQQHFYAQTHGVGGERGLGNFAQQSRQLVDVATKTIADFFAVRAEELIFTSGATTALNIFAQTWGRHNLTHDDQIILSVLNHHSNISPWHLLAQELNLHLKFLPIHPDTGALDISSLESLLLEPATRLLSLTHMSNVTGAFIPLDKISAILKKVNKIRTNRHLLPVRILIDGAQGALWRPRDFTLYHLDFYIFTGHKMAAATGIGGLLARREHLISGELPPFFVGGGAVEHVTLENTQFVSNLERRFSAGTHHSAGIVNLAGAISYLSTLNLEQEYERVSLLAKELHADNSFANSILTPLFPAQPPSPIIAFTSSKYNIRDIANFLALHGVATRVGHHCTKPLHQSINVEDSLRFSFSLHNTPADISTIITLLQDLTNHLGL